MSGVVRYARDRSAKVTWPRIKLTGSVATFINRLLIVMSGAIVWQTLSDHNLINPLFFGSPLGIVASLKQGLIVNRILIPNLGSTLTGTLAAFVLGSATGIGCGLLFAISPSLGRFFDPFIMAFNALPRIALAPLFILWFGLGMTSKITVGVSSCFVILLINTVAGTRSIDPDLQLLVRTLGATSAQTFFRITLPGAVPTIFAGLRLGLIYALLGVVSAEIIGSVNGLGVQLTQYAGVFDTSGVFAILVLLAGLGTVLTWGMSIVENWLLRWR